MVPMLLPSEEEKVWLERLKLSVVMPEGLMQLSPWPMTGGHRVVSRLTSTSLLPVIFGGASSPSRRTTRSGVDCTSTDSREPTFGDIRLGT